MYIAWFFACSSVIMRSVIILKKVIELNKFKNIGNLKTWNILFIYLDEHSTYFVILSAWLNLLFLIYIVSFQIQTNKEKLGKRNEEKTSKWCLFIICVSGDTNNKMLSWAIQLRAYYWPTFLAFNYLMDFVLFYFLFLFWIFYYFTSTMQSCYIVFPSIWFFSHLIYSHLLCDWIHSSFAMRFLSLKFYVDCLVPSLLINQCRN